MGLPGPRGSVWEKSRSWTRLQDAVLQRSQVRSGDESRGSTRSCSLCPAPGHRAEGRSFPRAILCVCQQCGHSGRPGGDHRTSWPSLALVTPRCAHCRHPPLQRPGCFGSSQAWLPWWLLAQLPVGRSAGARWVHPGPPRAGEGGGLPGDGTGEGWEAWGSGGLEAGSLASGAAARRIHVQKKAHSGHEDSSPA